MDINDYAFEVIVRSRLAELRAEGERQSRFEVGRPTSRPLRDTVGRALIRMGVRLVRVRKNSFSEAQP